MLYQGFRSVDFDQLRQFLSPVPPAPCHRPSLISSCQSDMERANRGGLAKNFNCIPINSATKQHSDFRPRRSLPFDEPVEFRRPRLSIASGQNAIYLRVAFKFADRPGRIRQFFKRAMECGFRFGAQARTLDTRSWSTEKPSGASLRNPSTKPSIGNRAKARADSRNLSISLFHQSLRKARFHATSLAQGF